MVAEKLITDHLDLWTAAIKRKSSAGRGSSTKVELYGIKKLRDLILELAVRGLLVPQEPTDEPAGKLLKMIAAEKAKLVAEGKIKKDKPLPTISEKDKPFTVPNSWEWIRLADVGYDFGQKTPSETITYIDVGAIDNRLGLIDNPTILSAEEAPSRARKLVKCGTIIYSTVRPYLLNIAIIQKNFDPEPIASTAFAVIHPFENISGHYVYRYLRSPSFVSYVESVQTGIAYPAINDRQFFSGLIPLPPAKEQLRIVAKVDKLMALCDQLEQQTDASLSAHQTLVKTLLSSLTSAYDHVQFASSWQRIAEHFDTLLTTEESIDQLKQTILQLAMRGLLVSQDPEDEPASGLIQKIAAEKAKLVKEGKIKVDKPQPSITEQDMPFKLPAGWELVRFGNLLINRDSERIPLSVDERATRSGNYDYYGASGVIDSIDAYLFDKPLLLIGEDGANLINRSTPIAFMAYGKYWVNNHAHVLDGYSEELLQYVCMYINSISLEPYVTGTAQPKMNQAKMNGIVLPIPPLAEQCRIIAQVDRLMALCDQLKSRLRDAQATQVHLANTLAEKALARA